MIDENDIKLIGELLNVIDTEDEEEFIKENSKELCVLKGKFNFENRKRIAYNTYNEEMTKISEEYDEFITKVIEEISK